MPTIPELIPISELRLRQNQVLSHLAAGPVVLTQHSRAAAVLVDVAEWNRIQQYVERLERLLEDHDDARYVSQVEQRLAAGDDELVDWEEIEAELDLSAYDPQAYQGNDA